jgi:hypothetical protein
MSYETGINIAITKLANDLDLTILDKQELLSYIESLESKLDFMWRWHKWGEYIGTKNPQHEYLYDEDESIQEVFCYHIYKRKV